MVWMAGFEPAAPKFQASSSDLADLHPVKFTSCVVDHNLLADFAECNSEPAVDQLNRKLLMKTELRH